MDLLKLKAYKLFKNIDADLSWLLFKEANLFLLLYHVYDIVIIRTLTRHSSLYFSGNKAGWGIYHSWPWSKSRLLPGCQPRCQRDRDPRIFSLYQYVIN